MADRIQIEQVLVNLIRNAFESLRLSNMPRPIIVRTALNDACCVAVDVADNGLGIAADAADRIFERFFTTKPDGMGMGLCVSRSIIESHGGKLWGRRRRPTASCLSLHATRPQWGPQPWKPAYYLHRG